MSNIVSPIRMFLLRWAKILQREPTKKTQTQLPPGDIQEELLYQARQDVFIKIDNELLETLKREGRDCCSAEELSDAISTEDAVKIQTAMYDKLMDATGATRVSADEPININMTFHHDWDTTPALNEGKEPNDYTPSPEIQARLDAGEAVPIAELMKSLPLDQQERIKRDLDNAELQG